VPNEYRHTASQEAGAHLTRNPTGNARRQNRAPYGEVALGRATSHGANETKRK